MNTMILNSGKSAPRKSFQWGRNVGMLVISLKSVGTSLQMPEMNVALWHAASVHDRYAAYAIGGGMWMVE